MVEPVLPSTARALLARTARVQRDVEDGMELGVQGTPTFYLDGELLQPRTYEDFTQALDEALES